MIQINEKYRITIKCGYCAEVSNAKGGYDEIGRTNSLADAVSVIIDYEFKERLRMNYYDRQSAIEEFRKIKNEFSDLLRSEQNG